MMKQTTGETGVAVARAVRHANPEWMDTAFQVGEQLAREYPLFTSAAIDMEMMLKFPEITTHEKRAMAGVMLRLKGLKIVAPTGEFVFDPRENCHNQNKRVWRSLIYGNGK